MLAIVASRLHNRPAMRRASLLAVLLTAPATVVAQTAPTPSPGQITFPDVSQSPIDGYINLAECRGGTIKLSWRVQFEPGMSFINIASYQLYAANKIPSPAPTGNACTKRNGENGDNSVQAGSVGTVVTSNLGETMLDVEYLTSQIAAASGKGACNATAAEDIEICVEATDSPAGAGNLVGTARGKLILSLVPPNTPTDPSTPAPGEGALNVSWSKSPGDPVPDYYVAQATTGPNVDPTQTATVTVGSGTISALDTRMSARISHLTDGVVYQVTVTAFSIADNPSLEPAFAGTGSPTQVNDFFEMYKADGGREVGGCSSGTAGLLALAGVGALLALRRRP
jgi:MYXO-CTERM domain-containing protein